MLSGATATAAFAAFTAVVGHIVQARIQARKQDAKDTEERNRQRNDLFDRITSLQEMSEHRLREERAAREECDRNHGATRERLVRLEEKHGALAEEHSHCPDKIAAIEGQVRGIIARTNDLEREGARLSRPPPPQGTAPR
jgi:chromosome segregation ATPase